jgi:hypothetical protein
MKNKAIKQEVKKSELEKAQEVLQKAEQEKIDAFMKDYKEVCMKHKMELTANPKIQWAVNKINN